MLRPTVADMLEVCKFYNIPFVAENKAYSRDWMMRGRIRVNLTSVENESLNTSMSIFISPESINRNETIVSNGQRNSKIEVVHRSYI